jgi:DNA-directed RNA polymerase specialized sigma24 family protein
MRRLLSHHARPLHRKVEQVELSDDLDLEATAAARMAEVEGLLDRLSSIDSQLRTIVEMRVFEGFSIPDIAARLNCGARTVDRRWAFARKWLEHQLVPARP